MGGRPESSTRLALLILPPPLSQLDVQLPEGKGRLPRSHRLTGAVQYKSSGKNPSVGWQEKVLCKKP